VGLHAVEGYAAVMRTAPPTEVSQGVAEQVAERLPHAGAVDVEGHAGTLDADCHAGCRCALGEGGAALAKSSGSKTSSRRMGMWLLFARAKMGTAIRTRWYARH
jgi:hypothetical protein